MVYSLGNVEPVPNTFEKASDTIIFEPQHSDNNLLHLMKQEPGIRNNFNLF